MRSARGRRRRVLTYSLTHLLTYLLTYSLTHLLTYLLTHLLTHLLTYLLTYLLTHILTYSLTYLLTYLYVTGNPAGADAVRAVEESRGGDFYMTTYTKAGYIGRASDK